MSDDYRENLRRHSPINVNSPNRVILNKYPQQGSFRPNPRGVPFRWVSSHAGSQAPSLADPLVRCSFACENDVDICLNDRLRWVASLSVSEVSACDHKNSKAPPSARSSAANGQQLLFIDD
jgi:hypothetical protein